MSKHICVVAGSNGKNLVLAQTFKEHLESQGHTVSLIDVVSAQLPLYSPVQEGKLSGAELIVPFREALAADYFVFCNPEYNGGLPPAFTNFLAWASRSAKDWRVHFNTKRAVIATHSGGDGTQALAMMRLQLAYIGMTVIGRGVSVSDRRPLEPAALMDVCRQLVS